MDDRGEVHDDRDKQSQGCHPGLCRLTPNLSLASVTDVPEELRGERERERERGAAHCGSAVMVHKLTAGVAALPVNAGPSAVVDPGSKLDVKLW
eukprot:9330682-Pyramimonas_sp.AAC.1